MDMDPVYIGEKLVREFIAHIQTKNWDMIEKSLAPYYQEASPRGTRNKAQAIEVYKATNISNYSISNIITTEGPGVLIVTYSLLVDGIYEDREVLHKPASRISVWQNNQGAWQMIAHARYFPTSSID